MTVTGKDVFRTYTRWHGSSDPDNTATNAIARTHSYRTDDPWVATHYDYQPFCEMSMLADIFNWS